VAQCLKCGGEKFLLYSPATCRIRYEFDEREYLHNAMPVDARVDQGYKALARCANCGKEYHVDDPRQRPIVLETTA
jgi:hypothetical protein